MTEKAHDDSNFEEAHEPEFEQILSKAVRDVLEGNITPDAFLKLARSRDADAVRYAIRRMADPSLEPWKSKFCNALSSRVAPCFSSSRTSPGSFRVRRRPSREQHSEKTVILPSTSGPRTRRW